MPVDPASFRWPVVGPDSTGPLVRTAQLLLNADGATLTVDGTFGPATRAATEAFQNAKAMTVDGKVGKETWPALVPLLKKGSRGDGVVAAQELLNARKEPAAPDLKVDGLYGSGTEAAVLAVQQYEEVDLAKDGILGPHTWTFLLATPD